MPYKSNSEILCMYQQGLDGTVKRILVICKNKRLFTIASFDISTSGLLPWTPALYSVRQ